MKRQWVWLAGAAAIGAVASSAQAQTAADSERSAPVQSVAQDDSSEGVSDIIVTAQRTEQSIQRVPVSVQPVTGEDLQRRRLNDINQLQTAVPSLQMSSDNTLSLRGVGSTTGSPLVDSSVGISVDEVSLGIPVYMNYFGFEDIERVEVLEGPQGLLFGRNASAGLLSIIGKRPQLGEVSGRVYAESDYRDSTPGGGWGQIVKGTLNLPVGDKVALRFNAIYSDQDAVAAVVAKAPGAKVADYQRQFGLRGKLLAEPTDRLSIYVIGDYAQNRGLATSFDRTYRALAVGSLNTAAVAKDGVTPGADNLSFGSSSRTGGGVSVNSSGVSANVTYDLSDAVSVSNILAYRHYTLDSNPDFDFTTSDGIDVNRLHNNYNQLSNEFRVLLKPGNLIDGQAGLFYFRSRLNYRFDVGAAGYGALDPLLAPYYGAANSYTNPAFGTDLASTAINHSYAAFGQVNIHPMERFTLLAGGRITRDENSIALVQNQKFYPVPLGASNYSANESIANTDFSWKVGAQYEFTPDIMAYSTYSKGYKGPAFNTSAATANTKLGVGPETVHNLEVGIKSTFLDRKLRLNLTAFREIFDNFQVQGFDPATTSYLTQNAAKVKAQGLELLAEARPVRALTITAAASFIDSKFEDYQNDRCYPGQTGCTATGAVDSSGNRTPSSAKFTSTVSAVYEKPISSAASLSISGDWYHRSPVNFSSNGNPLTRLGIVDTFGASIGVDIDNRFQLSVFCKNCTDKKVPTFIGVDSIDATVANLNSSQQVWGFNSVRTIGLSAGFQF